MPTYPFLSDEWIAESRRLREEHVASLTSNSKRLPRVRMNLVITGVPKSETVDAHLDTSEGVPELDLGHLRDPELTLMADYATARAVFIDGSVGAAMEAMQKGRMKVEGGLMKLMKLAGLQSDPDSAELARKIRAITA